MVRVAREIVVAAPPEEVFAALVEPARRAKWLATMIEEPLPEGARIEVGTRIKGRRRHSTTGSRYEFTITALEPGRRLAMRVVRNGEPAGTATFELSPAAGGTLVRDAAEVELRGLQKVMAPLVQATMERDLAAELAALKRHVEHPEG